jgi:hypothetical protein
LYALLLSGLLATQPAGSTADIRYEIAVSPALDTLEATVCFHGWTPSRLVSRLKEARDYLTDVRPAKGDLHAQTSSRQIRLSNVSAGDCLHYTVNLEAAVAAQAGTERVILHQGDNVLMSSGVWLWRPARIPDNTSVELQFDLPEGMQVSVPWQRIRQESALPGFRLDRTPIEWRDLTAFGYFEARDVRAGGAILRMAVLDADEPANSDDMSGWIHEAASAVSALYGRFPLQHPQVLVVPIGAQSEAVPWAQVLRGGGTAAHFFIDQNRPLSEFRNDWTATHELSHMLLPYVGRGDAWLSEGFASYYQNVLRARAGMVSEQVAWQKLYAGFGRGRRDSGDKTLAYVSANMRESGGYMRVYWSGAAIAMMADVELRRRSKGRLSLDIAMAELAKCCLPGDRTWSAKEVFSRLDLITGDDVFMSLYKQNVNSRHFPEISDTSAQLGITEREDRLHLSSAEDALALRAAIMSTPKMFAVQPQDALPAHNATP